MKWYLLATVLVLGIAACRLQGIALATVPARSIRQVSLTGTPAATSGQSFSPLAVVPLLTETWQSYKGDFIQGDGRVIDHYRDAVSTSEGESYALLRSVWMNDRPEFDLIWKWTQDNIQVRHDKLFGYLWGQHGNTSNWSILDSNSASDADEDIALALVFASNRWQDPHYLKAARAVIGDIWRHDVAVVRGEPYLTAGSWAPAQKNPGPAIDPSYLAPYEYRIFAHVDPSHPWSKLVDTSYQMLTACTRANLGEKKSAGLPPNWCALSRASGQVTTEAHMTKGTVYGYDAFRVMWRVALDYVWNKAPAAKKYLQSVSFLRTRWNHGHRLYEEYRHNGSVLTKQQDPTVYGGDIGNFVVTDPSAAQTIAFHILLPLLHEEGAVAYWDQRYNYYEQNWVWFGLALMSGQLPNLAAIN